MEYSGKLLFLVDDDKMILNFLEYVFQSKNGYRIMSFFSGEECIRNMHLKPDLVVLDYILSEKSNDALDGLATLKKLKSIDKNIPVIVLSGQTDDNSARKLLENGARKILKKDDYFADALEKFIIEVISEK